MFKRIDGFLGKLEQKVGRMLYEQGAAFERVEMAEQFRACLVTIVEASSMANADPELLSDLINHFMWEVLTILPQNSAIVYNGFRYIPVNVRDEDAIIFDAEDLDNYGAQLAEQAGLGWEPLFNQNHDQ